MKRIIILLLFTAIACAPRKTDREMVTGDSAQSHMHAHPPPKDPENFEEFFTRFKADSLFQVQRVKFPWTVEIWEAGENKPRRQFIEKQNWKYLNFHYHPSFATRQLDAYTQTIHDIGDTVKLELRGVDNGIYIDYDFVKENNKWILVSEKDYSN